MKILFLHQNFPAQFGPIAAHRASLGDDIIFVSENNSGTKVNNVKSLIIKFQHSIQSTSLNSQLDCSNRFYHALIEIKGQNWYPDVVVSHTGWGCGLWSKLVFPKSKLVSYSEWWFSHDFWQKNKLASDSFLNFDSGSDQKLYRRNLSISLELSESNFIITPTKWQRDQLPSCFASQALVIHEGVDTDFYKFNPIWRPKDKFRLTYVSRGFEPIRGFHYFINSLPLFLELTSNTEVLIAGEDKICYGGHNPSNHSSWKAWALDQLEPYIRCGRVRFVGRLENPYYARFLKSSHLHCYLSQPFIPSWSLVEAMSSGCNLLVSDNEAVREVVSDVGVYVDPVDPTMFSNTLISLSNSISSGNIELGYVARIRAIDCYNRVASLRCWNLVIDS